MFTLSSASASVTGSSKGLPERGIKANSWVRRRKTESDGADFLDEEFQKRQSADRHAVTQITLVATHGCTEHTVAS